MAIQSKLNKVACIYILLESYVGDRMLGARKGLYLLARNEYREKGEKDLEMMKKVLNYTLRCKSLINVHAGYLTMCPPPPTREKEMQMHKYKTKYILAIART